MPYVKIQTNKAVDEKSRQATLQQVSALIARQLGKPEEYVMVCWESSATMLFAGRPEPAAFLEVKAIGLTAKEAGALSRALCELVESALAIPKARAFLNFTDVPAHLWGWNGETF